MKIGAFGKDLTGTLLFSPLDEDTFARELAAALEENAPSLRGLAQTTAKAVTFRGEIKQRVKNPADPREAGWTFVVAESDSRRDQIVQILGPLAQHRNMDDPAAPLVFRGEAEESWGDWLQDNYWARELDGKTVPQYVLMAGGRIGCHSGCKP